MFLGILFELAALLDYPNTYQFNLLSATKKLNMPQNVLIYAAIKIFT